MMAKWMRGISVKSRISNKELNERIAVTSVANVVRRETEMVLNTYNVKIQLKGSLCVEMSLYSVQGEEIEAGRLGKIALNNI